MNFLPSPVLALALPTSWGPVCFIAVFLFTAIGLLFIPKSLLGEATSAPTWWRNARFWAVAICVVQMAVYWVLG